MPVEIPPSTTVVVIKCLAFAELELSAASAFFKPHKMCIRPILYDNFLPPYGPYWAFHNDVVDCGLAVTKSIDLNKVWIEIL